MEQNVIQKVIDYQKKRRLTDDEMVKRMGNVIVRQRWTAVRADPQNANGLKVLKGILIGWPGKYDQDILDFIKNA